VPVTFEATDRPYIYIKKAGQIHPAYVGNNTVSIQKFINQKPIYKPEAYLSRQILRRHVFNMQVAINDAIGF